jgi:hypothetical protein
LDSSGNLRRTANTDLEKLFGFLPLLQRSERHPTSVVIHQVIVIVKLAQEAFDLCDGILKHREGYLKMTGGDACLRASKPFERKQERSEDTYCNEDGMDRG